MKIDDDGVRYDVAGLGNALVDALVRMDERSLLGARGYARGHMTPVDHDTWQEIFNEVQVNHVEIHSGGSCANTIAALGMMGARSIYCGQVGDDQLGHLYAARMREACGQDALQWTSRHNTGKCLSLISTHDAERTMLTDLGAAVTMESIEPFDPHLRECRLFHLTGYLFLGEPMRSRAMEAIAIAAQAELPISVDVADPFVVSMCKDILWHVIEEFADIVFLNEEEARTLTGLEPREALAAVAEHAPVVVVKLGGKGSLVSVDGEVHHVPVFPVEALDTTGAGDAYAAGLLYGLLHGWPADRAGALASRVAALTVAQVGAVVRDRELLAAAIAACAP